MKMHRESFNYGLALLRIWMCFEVVLDHFWTHGTYTWPNPFAKYGAVAVPIFMIMSFYFTDVERVSKDNKMILNNSDKDSGNTLQLSSQSYKKINSPQYLNCIKPRYEKERRMVFSQLKTSYKYSYGIS